MMQSCSAPLASLTTAPARCLRWLQPCPGRHPAARTPGLPPHPGTGCLQPIKPLNYTFCFQGTARINSLQGPFLFANRRPPSAKSWDCFNHRDPVTALPPPASRTSLGSASRASATSRCLRPVLGWQGRNSPTPPLHPAAYRVGGTRARGVQGVRAAVQSSRAEQGCPHTGLASKAKFRIFSPILAGQGGGLGGLVRDAAPQVSDWLTDLQESRNSNKEKKGKKEKKG